MQVSHIRILLQSTGRARPKRREMGQGNSGPRCGAHVAGVGKNRSEVEDAGEEPEAEEEPEAVYLRRELELQATGGPDAPRRYTPWPVAATVRSKSSVIRSSTRVSSAGSGVRRPLPESSPSESGTTEATSASV